MLLAEGVGVNINRKKSNLLALSIGPHLAFREFMNSLGGDFYQIPHHMTHKQTTVGKGSSFIRSIRSIPAGYEYYVSESCFYYPVAARKLGRVRGKIIDLCASPTYYYMLKNRIRGVARKVLLGFLEDVDGFVFEGEFVRDVVRKLGVERPCMLAYTYVRPDRYDAFLKSRPVLGSKNIAIIATNDYFYKGLDILLEAMKIVNSDDPEITLTISPKNIDFAPLKHLMSENVKINRDVPSALGQASLYVHPSRGDVFPTSPLEAMLSGIPTIVSEDTGTKEIVGKVQDDFVVSLDPKDVAERILQYFSLSLREKSALSARFRTAAKIFNEKRQVADFKKGFGKLLSSL